MYIVCKQKTTYKFYSVSGCFLVTPAGFKPATS